MTIVIAYFIAAISTVALFTLLFFNAYRILSRKRGEVRNAEENVRLLQDCFNGMRNTPDEISARRMLETSTQIYKQIERSYNETLGKPIYKLPGFLMGFRKAEEKKQKV